MHQSAESGFALDDAVWDTHLAAESWQENDELGRETREEIDTAATNKQSRHSVESCCPVSGLCSGLKSSYVLIHTENSGEEIQTSLPEVTLQTGLGYLGSGCQYAYLNWIHIVGNDDKLGLLTLHQRGDRINT